MTYVATAPPVLVSRAAAAPAGRSETRWRNGWSLWADRCAWRTARSTSISLARVDFTDSQVKYLAPLAGLGKLDLEATDVSDLGLESLAGLSAPRDLNLSFTAVSDRGLAQLAPLTISAGCRWRACAPRVRVRASGKMGG